jgi:hypothetical protein
VSGDVSRARRDSLRAKLVTGWPKRMAVQIDAGQLGALLDALDESEELLRDGLAHMQAMPVQTLEEALERTQDALAQERAAVAREQAEASRLLERAYFWRTRAALWKRLAKRLRGAT